MSIKSYWTTFAKYVGLRNLVAKLDKIDDKRNRQAVYNTCWSVYKSLDNYNQLAQNRNPEDINLSTINFCRDHIEKTINYFTSKGFTPTIDREGELIDVLDVKKMFDLKADELVDSDIAEEGWYKEYIIKTKALVPLIERFWRFNFNRGISYRDLVEYASVLGDLFIYLYWDSDSNNVKMTVFKSEDVEIIPEKDNLHEVSKALIKYEYVDEENNTFEYELEITKDYVQIRDRGEVEYFEHGLGVIPFVHIAANRDLASVYGDSDVLKLLPLSILINEKLTDISEIISYHASPITISKGAKLSKAEKSPNKVWSVPRDADIYNLEMRGDLGSSNEYVDRLSKIVSQVSAYPKELLDGSVDKLSNTTGVAIQMLYKTLEDSLTNKKDIFQRGFRLIHNIVLKMYDSNNYVDLDLFRNYDIGVKFNSSLPKDALYEMQVIAQELLAGVESKHGAMRRLGKTNQEGILKERAKEILNEAELKAKTLGLYESDLMLDDSVDSAFKAVNKNVGGISSPSEQTKIITGREKSSEEE